MRDYGCFYYKMSPDNKLKQNPNAACWAGLRGAHGKDFLFKNVNKEYKGIIFIKEFRCKDVDESIVNRMIYLINKITPCKLVKIEEKEFIRIKVFERYSQNLVILNFIRMLWYKNGGFNHEKFFEDIFEDIRYRDPLLFLMECVKKNVQEKRYYDYGNHSLIYAGIIPKSKKYLKDYKRSEMEDFMTSARWKLPKIKK
jgi:hypothetical protein